MVMKSMNSPNCPNFCTIENYWVIVKQKMLKNVRNAEDLAIMYGKWDLFTGS